MKSTSEFMLNLMVGYIFRSQETSSPRKIGLFSREWSVLLPNGGGWNIFEIGDFSENVKFWAPFFCKELLISQNWYGQPTVKFYMLKDVLPNYRTMLSMLSFLWQIAIFGSTRVSRCFGDLYRVDTCIQHRNKCFLLSLTRYKLHPTPCEIWGYVVHLGFEK
jgi:hypothetical protein